MATEEKNHLVLVNRLRSFYNMDYSVNRILHSIIFQVFQANRDLNTIVRHSLAEEVQVRFVRFYPVTFNNWPCMRIEIFA